MENELVCALCHRVHSFSYPIVVVLVFDHPDRRPILIVPDEEDEYRVCRFCEQGQYLVVKHLIAESKMESIAWHRAVLVFENGRSIEIQSKFQLPAKSFDQLGTDRGFLH